ncbi:S-protein homolog 5-like [Tripterygium wilfordii]|uniref:S-protein homolog 5-like n=1 Tax=Tripterygium wilfordii TaxID=458696 RepID=UPI0018F7EFDC|nr:S-protein homolog 5-like [Tripterygium wilfordii]
MDNNMKTRNSSLLLLSSSLWLLHICCSMHSENFGWAKYRVHIVNEIQNVGGGPLVIRCQSTGTVDDDLGVQRLGLHKEFSWAFHYNCSGSTLCFCRFTFGSRSTSFDVFRGVDDVNWCNYQDRNNGDYYWVITNEGFYFGCNPWSFRRSTPFSERYNW